MELALGGNLTGTVNLAGDGLTLTAPNGSAVLGYTGLVACDATGMTLHASLEVQAGKGCQDLLIQVNDAGAQGQITIDPFVREASLITSDGAAGYELGSSVSISGNGDTVVVGAPWATIGSNGEQGAAYVFTEPASGWANMAQTGKLTASDNGTDDEFGTSVSISGNTVVVGAPWATVGGSAQGVCYVVDDTFDEGPISVEQAELTASDGAVSDQFGSSVSISGNTVVVGAPWATVSAAPR